MGRRKKTIRDKSKITCNNCQCTFDRTWEGVNEARETCDAKRCMMKTIDANKYLAKGETDKTVLPDDASTTVVRKATEYEDYINFDSEDPICLRVPFKGKVIRYKYKNVKNVINL